MDIGSSSSGIVHQLLAKDNYETWRGVMQNYLQGQDLWDVVVSAEVDTHEDKLKKINPSVRHIIETLKKHFSPQNGKESTVIPDIEQGLWEVVQSVMEVETQASRKTKDAKALHIIQLSCRREILDEIRHSKTAKDAWNHLSMQYGSDFKANGGTYEQDKLDPEQKKVLWKVERGEDIGNISLNLDVWINSSSAISKTPLHAAIIAGNKKNVEKLVEEGKQRLVCMQDKHGYTALALVAKYTGDTDVAKCMIENKDYSKKLLTMQIRNKDVEIPIIILAAANAHKEMTNYLYCKTPLEVFDNDPENRILLLSLCIKAKIFDVALKLLKRHPDLPKESLSSKILVPELLRETLRDNLSPLEALAKMPSSFPSGCQYGFWRKFIYDNLKVEKESTSCWDTANSCGAFLGYAAVADKKKRRTFLLRLIHWGWYSKLVFTLLLLPTYVLGLLLRGIARLFIPIFKYLNWFGVRKIYDQKYTHWEVQVILSNFCQSIVDFEDPALKKASAYEAILHAVQHGITEFIEALTWANPNLLSAVDSCNRGIFSYAILHRKQNVFQLMHNLSRGKEIYKYGIDTFGNTLLHLAAHLGPPSDRDTRSGSAMQMQREIQWFKAVEKVVHPRYKEIKNGDGKKPRELFSENHNELVKSGEKWAKETATSFTIVATLITTIMFAAAFTVPGGNNQETGVPIFLYDRSFTTFLIADAVSLFTSATSVLIFIGILTSRYAEKDFLNNLPQKLLFALLFLFLSICSMIVVFCATITMILKGYRTYKWYVVAPTMSLGIIPIVVLLFSQLRLMNEIFCSTWIDPISKIKKWK